MGYGVTGENVYGEVSSADASAGVTVILYDANGVARPLATGERLLITDIQFVTAAGGACRLTWTSGGADTAGKRIFKGTFGANGGISSDYLTPHVGPKTTTPTLVAPIGQVDLQIHGIILAKN